MAVTLMMGGELDRLAATTDFAIDLTKRMKTSLKGVCALPDPATSVIYITGAETVVLGGTAVASMTEAQDKMIADYSEMFAAKSKAAGSWLQSEFTSERGSVAIHGAAANLVSDAFILPHEATDSGHPLNPAFEHVLMEAGLPLVLAPAKPESSDTCLIAWDGSPIAARAVKMHLPLIASYKKAVIAQNPDKLRHQWASASAASAEHLVELLHEQRMQVETVTLDGPVSDGLLKAAKTHDASLIVMGAYGHMRIGELLFGGTTSKLLHSDDAPALALSH
ncbi:MAG: universal stress protein [Planctomycetota bacterium]